MTVPADFDELWSNLPQWFECAKINPPDPATFKAFPQISGMNIPVDWETCCIQMSHALNMVGQPINYFNKNRVLTDASGNEYILAVPEMRDYLNKFGAADVIARIDANGGLMPRWLVQSGGLGDRKGIVAFGDRHIDLWNGTTIHGQGYIEAAIWEHATTLNKGLFFWDVST